MDPTSDIGRQSKEMFERMRLKNADPAAMELFMKLMLLHRVQRHTFRNLTASCGVQHMQSFGLMIVSTHEGLSQRELADFMHLKRATVTTMIRRMAAAGLIERRPDPCDQRIIRLFVSEKGKATDARVEALMEDFINACYRAGKKERRCCIACIDGIISRIGEYGQNAAGERDFT